MGLGGRCGKVGQIGATMFGGWPTVRKCGEISVQVDGAFEQIELDFIAILNRSDGASNRCFRRAMNAHDAVRDP